jgi:mannose-6-phosphate isomerase-like protein (cupin superfamily)
VKRKQLRLGRGFRLALGNRHAQVAEMVIPPGETEGAGANNRHRAADQWLYIISGTGTARVNGRRVALRPGTLLLIERGDRHEIKNTGRRLLRTLNIYVPPAYTRAGNELSRGKP